MELVWGSSSSLFSGQPHPGTVWDTLYSSGPHSFVEPGAHAYTLSSRHPRGKFPGLSERPKGTLLETHSTDAPVDVEGVVSGHDLVGSRTALLTSLLRDSPSWKSRA